MKSNSEIAASVFAKSRIVIEKRRKRRRTLAAAGSVLALAAVVTAAAVFSRSANIGTPPAAPAGSDTDSVSAALFPTQADIDTEGIFSHITGSEAENSAALSDSPQSDEAHSSGAAPSDRTKSDKSSSSSRTDSRTSRNSSVSKNTAGRSSRGENDETHEEDDSSKTNGSRSGNSKANNSKANSSKANSSKTNSSKANSSKANSSKANSSKANSSKANSSKQNPTSSVTSSRMTVEHSESRLVDREYIDSDRKHHGTGCSEPIIDQEDSDAYGDDGPVIPDTDEEQVIDTDMDCTAPDERPDTDSPSSYYRTYTVSDAVYADGSEWDLVEQSDRIVRARILSYRLEGASPDKDSLKSHFYLPDGDEYGELFTVYTIEVIEELKDGYYIDDNEFTVFGGIADGNMEVQAMTADGDVPIVDPMKKLETNHEYLLLLDYDYSARRWTLHHYETGIFDMEKQNDSVCPRHHLAENEYGSGTFYADTVIYLANNSDE